MSPKRGVRVHSEGDHRKLEVLADIGKKKGCGFMVAKASATRRSPSPGERPDDRGEPSSKEHAPV